MPVIRRSALVFCLLAVFFLIATSALAGRVLRQATSQEVYVPVYSHVYQGIKGRPYNLSALLSIRNVDHAQSITVTSVQYYNDHGKMMKEYVSEPVTIGPMVTYEVHIPERDQQGGSGANFTVKWTSTQKVNIPIIQAVMIGTASTQGISFVCDGVVIEED
ncbi:DUF3124 domain-containing protein [Pseudodesulfovibrio sp.]|uniref:DUF3124 domain-containing protein n=1 Tax=unclassified Pseudodesulfovibrio TaxID=2661612 RepID=UPI003AFFD133